MENFIQRKEDELTSRIDEITKLGKRNQILEIMVMIKADEFEMLKQEQKKHGDFVSYSELVKACNGAVDYIEKLHKELENKLAELN